MFGELQKEKKRKEKSTQDSVPALSLMESDPDQKTQISHY